MWTFVSLFCVVLHCLFSCLCCDNFSRTNNISTHKSSYLECCSTDCPLFKNNGNQSIIFNGFTNDKEYLPRNKDNIIELWTKYPLTILENSTKITPSCRTAYNKFLKALRQYDFNAIKMFDATAKLSSGILRGNVNQYGDFDECLELEEAQYCLAEIDIQPLWKEPHIKFRDLAHSHFAIQETLDDPKHRVPGFTMIRWGFCIPKECSEKDLENSISEKLGVQSRIRPNMCQKANKSFELTYGDILARTYFVILLLIIILSTLLYNWGKNDNCKNFWIKILLCFSFTKNYGQLTESKVTGKEIQALHGVRFFSALALIMSHKVMALFYNPFINRSVMTENLGMKWSVIGRTAILYTECFMLLSGLLNASSLFADLDRDKTIKLKDNIIRRLFRILPNLLTVILFCTYILPNLGSGPLWPLVVNHHSELCKKNMWKNVLLIHNYFGFENMCLTHTHQLGIDMQLFLTTPIFVYLLWKNKKTGLCVIGFVALLSTILRFWVTYENDLSHVVYFGIPISRMFKTADLSYILPTHRATIYLLGIVLAYVLRYTSKIPNFTKVQLFSIWGILYIASFSAWFGPVHMSVKGYKYSKIDAAIYGALAPIFWGCGIAWIIYTVNRGFGTWFGPLLTWKYFAPFTKIAYAVYLVQFPVFFYNIGKTRHVDEYKPYMMMQVVETGLIIFLSILLTLTVELPFHNICQIILNKDHGAERKNSSNKTKKIVCVNERINRGKNRIEKVG